MDNAGRLRFEDPAKVSQAELAPPSAHELLQQEQQTQHGAMEGGGVGHSQKPPRDSGGDEPSEGSKQNDRRPTLRGPGIRGLSGPSATLYAIAFHAWGAREEDRASRQHGDEGRGSPTCHRGAASRPRGSSRRPRPALALTRDMCSTYSSRNPLFRFTPNVPRRVLTLPSAGVGNDGLDNVEFNLIARVNDVLEAPGTNYSVLDLLGQGTFGQVFRCQERATKDIVAIKVVKNKPAYRNQALLEIQVAKLLNERYDPNDAKNIVRLLDYFHFQNHLCLVFELLSINLYEFLKQNQFRGLPLSLIRHFIKQILEALGALEQANVIHCDLKPENVLLMNKGPEGDEVTSGSRGGGAGGGIGAAPGQAAGANRLKVIDFGSACYEGQTMYSYIQSRFYRSPEVLLGLPYDGAIDIWSLGCISIEMFLGLPIFPGVSDHNQICRIVEMTGSLPEFMLENGKDTLKFFRRVNVPTSEGGGGGGEGGSRGWRAGADMAVSPDCDRDDAGRERARRSRGRGYRHVLKTPEEYARDTGTAVPQLMKYFKHSNIPDIVQSYPLPGARRRGAGGGSAIDTAQEKEARRVFTHFVLGLLNPNPWKRWTPKQAASHPFITGQPHPRDLGALTIADDPLITDRYTRQMQAMQLQQHKDQREAERKHAQRLRQHQQQQRQQQEQQQREHSTGMAIPGATSQSRGLSSLSVSVTGSGTPGSMGSHTPYHASPLRHTRRGSGDGGLMAMHIAHTPQGPRGGEDHVLGSMSRPIDVPDGGDRGGGGGGMGAHNLFSRDSSRGGGVGGGHDLTARSMGYNGRGGSGTSYPPLGGDDAELDAGRAEAYSYSAASFTMGGAPGNYVASDFGYALQRPGLRYEPTYKQSPPATHSSSLVGSGSVYLGRRRGSDIIPGMTHRGSFAGYHHHHPGEGARVHERGGRALSMDQSQSATLQYYLSSGAGGVGGQVPGGGGRFGPQYYPSSMQQASASVSASTAGPPGYTPLASGGFLAPPSSFRGDVPQASVPWVRAGRGIGHSQPLSGGPRAHSTSPLFGRPLALDFPSGDQQDVGHDPNPDDMQTRESGGGGGGGGDIWPRRVSGVESDELAGGARQARQAAQRVHRQEHRRGLATDPEVLGEGAPFAFQLDDGRVPTVGGASGGMLGSSSVSSPLHWMGGGGGGAGVEDPEGVHKRSLNGTTKGVSPAAGRSAGTSSPRDEGDLIRRVACDDPPSVLQQQPPQSGSLLSQQLMQYQHQQQQQGQGQQRSRTPFGSAAPAPIPPEQPPSPAPHQQLPDPYGMGGAGRSSGERWMSSHGGSQQAGVDDIASDQGAGAGVGGGSAWVSSSSTRALRRRGSSGSSEFYFVDTLQQQGGGGGAYAQPPMSPAGPSPGRSIYSGRGHAAGGVAPPSNFRGHPQHAQQGQVQGQLSPMPPRPPRPGDSSGIGLDKGSWAGGGGEGSWGSRTSPSQALQQRLPTPPRSMGGRGAGSWDDRGTPGGPDIMRSIHEGNSSPDT